MFKMKLRWKKEVFSKVIQPQNVDIKGRGGLDGRRGRNKIRGDLRYKQGPCRVLHIIYKCSNKYQISLEAN